MTRYSSPLMRSTIVSFSPLSPLSTDSGLVHNTSGSSSMYPGFASPSPKTWMKLLRGLNHVDCAMGVDVAEPISETFPRSLSKTDRFDRTGRSGVVVDEVTRSTGAGSTGASILDFSDCVEGDLSTVHDADG